MHETEDYNPCAVNTTSHAHERHMSMALVQASQLSETVTECTPTTGRKAKKGRNSHPVSDVRQGGRTAMQRPWEHVLQNPNNYVNTQHAAPSLWSASLHTPQPPSMTGLHGDTGWGLSAGCYILGFFCKHGAAFLSLFSAWYCILGIICMHAEDFLNLFTCMLLHFRVCLVIRYCIQGPVLVHKAAFSYPFIYILHSEVMSLTFHPFKMANATF